MESTLDKLVNYLNKHAGLDLKLRDLPKYDYNHSPRIKYEPVIDSEYGFAFRILKDASLSTKLPKMKVKSITRAIILLGNIRVREEKKLPNPFTPNPATFKPLLDRWIKISREAFGRDVKGEVKIEKIIKEVTGADDQLEEYFQYGIFYLQEKTDYKVKFSFAG